VSINPTLLVRKTDTSQPNNCGFSVNAGRQHESRGVASMTNRNRIGVPGAWGGGKGVSLSHRCERAEFSPQRQRRTDEQKERQENG
jgi:hypothetical protein